MGRLAGWAFLLLPILSACADAPVSCTAAEAAHGCAVMTETELFLGRARPDGSIVSEAEWRAFLADVATPLFPDGFTVIPAEGQWRAPGTGEIEREPTLILVILHGAADDERRLAALVAAYKRAFRQESVLRVDLESRASF
jgi:hypothetical protein